MTLNRLFLFCLALIGLAWIAAYVVDLRERTDDERIYERNVVPHTKAGTFPSTEILAQSLERADRRTANASLRLDLFSGAAGLCLAWMIVTVIRIEISWKRRNAPARPADPNAGSVIAELRRIGGGLIARGGPERPFVKAPPREVEINATAETIVFRNFTFITAFVGNRRSSETVLRFHDILAGRIWTNSGRDSLYLRTTSGRVTITDAVKPFPDLARVLLDAAEVNRSVPARYAAALAREPRVKTPWYGWLIFVLALAVVGGLAVLLWNLTSR